MCQKRNTRRIKLGEKFVRVDACMVETIKFLNGRGILTLGCCCGHGRFPMTIIAFDDTIIHPDKIIEIFSGKEIPRKKRFYKKDKEGFYYIPETLEKNGGAKNE